MRILIFGINFYPELTGIGKYTGDMAFWLAAQGHEVTVVTGMPYYPDWKTQEPYNKRLWFMESISGVKIYRCPMYVPKKVTSLKRIFHEFSFVFSLLPAWLLLLMFRKKYDIVFSVSPPFHITLLPLIYAKLRGAKLVSHIQDLQIDAARDLGMIRNKSVLNLMSGVEKMLLRASNLVTTISEGMRGKIVNKGISQSKVSIFPNWVDEQHINPLPKSASLRGEFGLPSGAHVVLYSGNLGEKQGLEIIVEVASQLSNLTDLYFVIVGTGGGKDRLVGMVAEAALRNVMFFPLQPYEKLPALLAMADVHLVLQKKSASDLVMPSKLTSILASGGCPIITASPGTSLYEITKRHQFGFVVEPDNATALRDGILAALESDLDTYRVNARRYSEKFIAKQSVLREIEKDLKVLHTT